MLRPLYMIPHVDGEFWTEKVSRITRYHEDLIRAQVWTLAEANIVGSLYGDANATSSYNMSVHFPMFDCDDSTLLMRLLFDLQREVWTYAEDFDKIIVVPSRTPMHVHVYLNVQMRWHRVIKMLEHYSNHGWIDEKWAEACTRQGQTFLRVPNTNGVNPTWL